MEGGACIARLAHPFEEWCQLELASQEGLFFAAEDAREAGRHRAQLNLRAPALEPAGDLLGTGAVEVQVVR